PSGSRGCTTAARDWWCCQAFESSVAQISIEVVVAPDTGYECILMPVMVEVRPHRCQLFAGIGDERAGCDFCELACCRMDQDKRDAPYQGVGGFHSVLFLQRSSCA